MLHDALQHQKELPSEFVLRVWVLHYVRVAAEELYSRLLYAGVFLAKAPCRVVRITLLFHSLEVFLAPVVVYQEVYDVLVREPVRAALYSSQMLQVVRVVGLQLHPGSVLHLALDLIPVNSLSLFDEDFHIVKKLLSFRV